MQPHGELIFRDYKGRKRKVKIFGATDDGKLQTFAGVLDGFTNAAIDRVVTSLPNITRSPSLPSQELGQDSIDDRMICWFSIQDALGTADVERRFSFTVYGVKSDYLDDSGGLYVQLKPEYGFALAVAMSALLADRVVRYLGSRQRRKGYLMLTA